MPEKQTISVAQYIKALSRIRNRITSLESSFLSAHYYAPNNTATATQLARALGYKTYRTTNANYGRLASKIVDAFDYKLPQGYSGIGVVLTGLRRSGARHFALTMRPNLVKALDRMGWFESRPQIPDFDVGSTKTKEIDQTVVRALRDSRVGQGIFRSQVIAYWKQCAVTGCAAVELLRASHIKPWSVSDNAERLDPYNGLLLTPNYDVMFDRGMISFDDRGNLAMSKSLDPDVAQLFGIQSGTRLSQLDSKHLPYLKYHRKHVFQR